MLRGGENWRGILFDVPRAVEWRTARMEMQIGPYRKSLLSAGRGLFNIGSCVRPSSFPMSHGKTSGLIQLNKNPGESPGQNPGENLGQIYTVKKVMRSVVCTCLSFSNLGFARLFFQLNQAPGFRVKERPICVLFHAITSMKTRNLACPWLENLFLFT